MREALFAVVEVYTAPPFASKDGHEDAHTPHVWHVPDHRWLSVPLDLVGAVLLFQEQPVLVFPSSWGVRLGSVRRVSIVIPR